MITVMRNKFKANGMTYIIWISLGSMLIGSLLPSLFKKSGSGEPWAVKVNDTEISYRLFMYELSRNRDYIMRLRAQYGQFADYFLQSMGASDAQSLTFKQLVTQELLAQALQNTGIVIDDKYAKYKLHDVQFVTHYCADVLPPQFIDADGTLNVPALRQYLRQQGINMDTFQNQINEKVSNWFFHTTMQTYAYTPTYLSTYEYMQQNSAKSYSYIHFKHEDFLARVRNQELSADEIARFFEKESAQKKYYVPEKRSGMVWTFTPESYGVAVDAEVIEQYYEQHKTQKYIAQPAQLQARQLVMAFEPDTRQEVLATMETIHAQLVENPSSFAALAKTHSTDKETASKGGLMAPFARGKQEAALDRAAFVLKNDGDISPIVTLENSFVILQRVSKEQQTYKTLNEVRGSIEKELLSKSFTQAFGKEARTAVDSQDAATIEQFIKNHKGLALSLKSSARSEDSAIKTLFTIKDETYAMHIEGAQGSIVRLDAKEKGYTPALDTIRPVVIDDLYHQKASQALDKKIETIRAQVKATRIAAGPLLVEPTIGQADYVPEPLEDGDGFKKIAQKNKLVFETIQNISSDNSQLLKELREKGFDPMALLSMEQIGSFTVEKNGYDRYLIRLDEIAIKSSDDTADKQAQAKKHLEKQQQNAFIGSFIASLYRAATIDTNNTITMFEEENSI